ncbi:MAG: type II secretion system F family protein [Candidatus Cloacimonetes bacterium]|nr:type II secretion system F family protein [Candidatus Cloacimonadota bacterium]
MIDFRVTGKGPDGAPLQAVLSAKTKQEAKRILESKGIRIDKLEQRKEFNYTVTTPTNTKLKGKKQAYSTQELKDAFVKHGYKNVKVEAVLLDFKVAPPMQSILQFINLSSFMLQEEMAYDKILEILAEEEQNATLKNALKNIQSELKKGREGEDVFKQYEWVFGKFPAYMLGLATKSGNMNEVYLATAKYMERDAEYKRSLRSAFLSPMFTVVLMMGAVVYYVGWIFPATAGMFTRFGLPAPPLTQATLDLSDWFIANGWWISILVVVPTAALLLWFRTPQGQFYRDKWMVQLPVIGHLLHKTSIEIFFRVFGSVYSGADNNIETLKAASEASRNKWMEHGVKTIAIPMMLRDGAALVPAMAASKVFNQTTLNRLRSGAETGNILASANQIARFFEQETTYKMKGVIGSIEMFVMIYIGVVLVLLTVVSSEIAMVSPPVPGM